MKDESKTCWWCENEADSREHIFKKSDLKRIYGNTSYTHEFAPIIDDGINQRKVQGPNSRFVKWQANLCSNCNNAKSSSFDKAYDEFIKNVQPFFIEIMNNKFIDLQLIFGDEWEIKFKNLLKYYTKHIGCRLSNHELGTTKNIIDFLDNEDKLKDIAFTFEVRPMNKLAAEVSNEMFNDNYEVLNAGLFHAMEKNEYGKKSAAALFSWLTTGWISFNYLIQDRVAPYGMNNLRNSILQFDIGPIINPEELDNFSNIADKISYLEDFGRVGNSNELQIYYAKIKERITV
jgi:hypothetical protein